MIKSLDVQALFNYFLTRFLSFPKDIILKQNTMQQFCILFWH